jgi:hypothetical protein
MMTVLPSPTWPSELAPQHHTTPESETAHACDWPEAINDHGKLEVI